MAVTGCSVVLADLYLKNSWKTAIQASVCSHQCLGQDDGFSKVLVERYSHCLW